MISGIIKVEVSAISRSRRLRLVTLTDCFKENNGKRIIAPKHQFNFDKPCSYFAVRELPVDIALGNHALCAQPTDYLLIR